MLKRKGQSTLEYAIIIAVVIAGLLAMQHYVKRGYEGRLKGASDDMGEQFDPGYYNASYNTTQESQVTQTVENGVSRTNYTDDQEMKKDGSEEVGAYTPGNTVFQ